MAKKILKGLKEIWYIPFIIIVVILINLFVYRPGVTVGESMEPTLHNHSPIIINLDCEVERKDVIVFSQEGEGWLVKRVIGLPGDTVQIKHNVIYINDEPIQDAVNIVMDDYGIAKEPVKLKDNEYFVMGDNRNHSYDSRAFGPIDADRILGVAEYALSPFGQIY